jgi:hypothetical protein
MRRWQNSLMQMQSTFSVNKDQLVADRIVKQFVEHHAHLMDDNYYET